MSITRKVNIKITGSVPADCSQNDYEVMKAKFQVICAEHDLDLEECYD